MKKMLLLVFIVSLFLLFLLNGCIKGCVKEDIGKPLEKKGEDIANIEVVEEGVKKEMPAEIPKEKNGEITLTMQVGETRLIELNDVQHSIEVLTIVSFDSSKKVAMVVDGRASGSRDIGSTITLGDLSITVNNIEYSPKEDEINTVTFVVKAES